MSYDANSFLAGLAVGRALWRPPSGGWYPHLGWWADAAWLRKAPGELGRIGGGGSGLYPLPVFDPETMAWEEVRQHILYWPAGGFTPPDNIYAAADAQAQCEIYPFLLYPEEQSRYAVGFVGALASQPCRYASRDTETPPFTPPGIMTVLGYQDAETLLYYNTISRIGLNPGSTTTYVPVFSTLREALDAAADVVSLTITKTAPGRAVACWAKYTEAGGGDAVVRPVLISAQQSAVAVTGGGTPAAYVYTKAYQGRTLYLSLGAHAFDPAKLTPGGALLWDFSALTMPSDQPFDIAETLFPAILAAARFRWIGT